LRAWRAEDGWPPKRAFLNRRAVVVVLLVIALLPLGAASIEGQEAEYLPTPYTADEIRDAWVEGFEVTTRTRSAAGETFSRTRVEAWSEKGFAMVEREVDSQGRPAPGAGRRGHHRVLLRR
jgi:hypothetical protein